MHACWHLPHACCLTLLFRLNAGGTRNGLTLHWHSSASRHLSRVTVLEDLEPSMELTPICLEAFNTHLILLLNPRRSSYILSKLNLCESFRRCLKNESLRMKEDYLLILCEWNGPKENVVENAANSPHVHFFCIAVPH